MLTTTGNGCYHFYRSDYRSVLVRELTVPEIAEKFGWRKEEIDAAELTAGGIREAVPGGWG
jgi:hypothetical protein